jgi:hypothetical protein
MIIFATFIIGMSMGAVLGFGFCAILIVGKDGE